MTDQNDLDRQVQESYKQIQQQNTGVAREYAESSIEALRQQVEDTRNTRWSSSQGNSPKETFTLSGWSSRRCWTPLPG